MSVTPVDPKELASLGEEAGRAIAQYNREHYQRADQLAQPQAGPPSLREQSQAAYDASRPRAGGAGGPNGGGDPPDMAKTIEELQKAGVPIIEATPNPDGTYTIEPYCPILQHKFSIKMGPPKGSFMIETQRIINAGYGAEPSMARDPLVINMVRGAMFIREVDGAPQNKPATWLEFQALQQKIGEIVLDACVQLYSQKWPAFAVVNLPLSGR